LSNESETSKSKSDSSLDEASKSLSEIMELGARAAEALGNPIYALANKIAVDTAMMELVNTAPKEREKRESLWQEIQAHGRISDILHGCVERAETATMSQTDPGLQALDDQGFGLEDGYPRQ
jgi:hypothetical protein